nr:siderophore-interacting protein [Propionicimonas sp.]
MARYPRLMPTEPRLFTATVARTERVSPSFQRVTITGPELATFEWLGRDHWFRLFLPQAPGEPLRLPKVKGRAWWRSYLMIPAGERPHCSNYTVADFRPAGEASELDIDVVLHWHGDELGGAVATWAVGAVPGTPVGFLDQGVMFDPPEDASEFCLAADETGLPGLRGILRNLPESATGSVFLEVPDAGDVTELAAPAGVDVRWLPRQNGHHAPGQLALAALAEFSPHPDGYAFVVGESGLATGGRRALKKAGLPTSRITFSGFWRA